MTEHKKHKKYPRGGVIFWVSIFLLTLYSCKNTTSPDDTNAVASVTVSNECGIAVDVYMDQIFQFSLDYQESRTIVDISLGGHEFESKKKGTETQLSFLSVEIAERGEFIWTLQSEASLHVTNSYGETLDIYGDGELLSDIDALGTLVIENVLLGERVFRANLHSDGSEVATLTIEMDENKPYFWTITK